MKQTSGHTALSFTFKLIDVPGATDTEVRGINNRGQVAGWFFDNTGEHGFLYRAGAYTQLDAFPNLSYPEAATYPQALNDRAQVAGDAVTNNTGDHGFIYDHGSFTMIDPAYYPGAVSINNRGDAVVDDGSRSWLYSSGTVSPIAFPGAISTDVYDINNRGEIVGTYAQETHGFTLKDGTYTSIDFPGASSTTVQAVNDKGDLVGNFIDSTGEHPFTLSHGGFQSIPINGVALFINNSGEIAGDYSDSAGEHGFVYDHGVMTTIDAPGTTAGTRLYGLNDNGQVLGNDLTGTHAFIATPKTLADLCGFDDARHCSDLLPFQYEQSHDANHDGGKKGGAGGAHFGQSTCAPQPFGHAQWADHTGAGS